MFIQKMVHYKNIKIFTLLIPFFFINSVSSNNVFISFGEKYHVTDYNINQYEILIFIF